MNLETLNSSFNSFKKTVSRGVVKGVANVIHVRNVYIQDRGGPISEILDGFLWLGNLYAAKSEATMSSFGITHIVSVTQFGEDAMFLDNTKYQYKIIQLHDEPTEDLKIYFDECFTFIQTALRDGGRVFVHCNQGRSRSATIVLAYLMRTKEMTFEEALNFLQTRRPHANPNAGFKAQLIQYEQELREFFHWEKHSKDTILADVRLEVAKKQKQHKSIYESDSEESDSSSSDGSPLDIPRSRKTSQPSVRDLLNKRGSSSSSRSRHDERSAPLIIEEDDEFAILAGRPAPTLGPNPKESSSRGSAKRERDPEKRSHSSSRDTNHSSSAYVTPTASTNYPMSSTGFMGPSAYDPFAPAPTSTTFAQPNPTFSAPSSFHSAPPSPFTSTSSSFPSQGTPFSSQGVTNPSPFSAQPTSAPSPFAPAPSPFSSTPSPFVATPTPAPSYDPFAPKPSEYPSTFFPSTLSSFPPPQSSIPSATPASTSAFSSDTPNLGRALSLTPYQRQVFDYYWAEADKAKRGVFPAADAAAFFRRSNLPTATLAQIWSIASNESPQLTPAQFDIALALVAAAQSGLPATLQSIQGRTESLSLPVFEGLNPPKAYSPF